MDIQLQQVITHAIGFLITLWILAKFAWKPLLKMLDERREAIVHEFTKIDDTKAEVAKLVDVYEVKLKEIDSERRQKLVEAVNEGKKVAEEMRTAAHAEARSIVEKARGDIQRDIAKARVELKEDMIRVTLAATEKLIKERLDEAGHRKLIDRFIDDLEKV